MRRVTSNGRHAFYVTLETVCDLGGDRKTYEENSVFRFFRLHLGAPSDTFDILFKFPRRVVDDSNTSVTGAAPNFRSVFTTHAYTNGTKTPLFVRGETASRDITT